MTTPTSSDILHYLQSHARENVLLLSELQRQDAALSARHALGSAADKLTIMGYRRGGRKSDYCCGRSCGHVVAVQGFYRFGRWFPYYTDAAVIEDMLADMLCQHVRWIIGVRHVVDPLMDRLRSRYAMLSHHDELDYLFHVDAASFQPQPAAGVRAATTDDIRQIASLRANFEAEYFGAAPNRIDREWCLRVADRYIRNGARVAERDGHIVAMAVTEGATNDVAQIGAVYTDSRYRRRGLAAGVVSSICRHHLGNGRSIVLVVRTDNSPALRAYCKVGFHYLTGYRMASFAR